MELLLICVFVFIAAILTLFSGFGLSTILVPVFALFFPINIAIGITAIVHLSNNIFKFIILGKSANKRVVLIFGIPAMIASFIGAQTLAIISKLKYLISYEIFGHHFYVMP